MLTVSFVFLQNALFVICCLDIVCYGLSVFTRINILYYIDKLIVSFHVTVDFANLDNS